MSTAEYLWAYIGLALIIGVLFGAMFVHGYYVPLVKLLAKQTDEDPRPGIEQYSVGVQPSKPWPRQ